MVAVSVALKDCSTELFRKFTGTAQDEETLKGIDSCSWSRQFDGFVKLKKGQSTVSMVCFQAV